MSQADPRRHPNAPHNQAAPHYPKTKTRHWSNVRGNNNPVKKPVRGNGE